MSKRLQWGLPETPPPKHPLRDTFLVYGGLALVVIILAWVTGGSVTKAVAVAAVFFVLASAWNAYRWRMRAREAARRGEQ
jgi:Flp pilus assembly protein TadB